jgi:hypothetical protein
VSLSERGKESFKAEQKIQKFRQHDRVLNHCSDDEIRIDAACSHSMNTAWAGTPILRKCNQ